MTFRAVGAFLTRIAVFCRTLSRLTCNLRVDTCAMVCQVRGLTLSRTMLGIILGYGALMLFFGAEMSHAKDQKPLWRIDLQALGVERARDEVTIKYSGSHLVVYVGSSYVSGREAVWVREPRLVLDSIKGEAVSGEGWSELSLPPWDDCPRTRSGKEAHGLEVVDCRKQMVIERTRGNGTKFDPSEYYLHEPGKERVLIFRARSRCHPDNPKFINDEHILLQSCDRNYLVVNKKGEKIYGMPNLAEPYLTLNSAGTRFAVYERDSSFFHSLEGTTDKLRVRVFRSSDGEMLFDYRWHTRGDDPTYDGRIALSDDGSLLAILQKEEALIFALAPSK